MKRPIALLTAPARIVLVPVTLCLLLAAGCSEGTNTGASAAASTPGGLAESEVETIVKTAKSPKAVMDEIKKKKMEKKGVVIPTKTSGNATRRPR
jgi:ABC-type glycerol-3-phosphate transport system substrate-binding protein